MSIPFATTTITIQRIEYADDTDAYDTQPAPTTVASGVRAVITTPSVNTTLSTGLRLVYSAKLTCDDCDLQAGDTVTDANTGIVWEVLNTVSVDHMLAVNHRVADLRQVTGAS